MSLVRNCDLCGETIVVDPSIFSEEEHATLKIYNFNDGYNTDPYNIEMDICHDCLLKRFNKEELC